MHLLKAWDLPPSPSSISAILTRIQKAMKSHLVRKYRGHSEECLWRQPLLFYKVPKVYDGTVIRGTHLPNMKSLCVMVRKYVQSENFPIVNNVNQKCDRWTDRQTDRLSERTHLSNKIPMCNGNEVCIEWKCSQCRSKVTVKVKIYGTIGKVLS